MQPQYTPSQRFWSKVNKTNTCWLWTAYKFPTGYGRFGLTHNIGVRAHRWAYEEANGPIPAGMELDHLCRTPACVRPTHLEAVTHRVNVMRGQSFAARNAAKTICPQGHSYDEKNTYHKPNGYRICRICHRTAVRKRYWAVTST